MWLALADAGALRVYDVPPRPGHLREIAGMARSQALPPTHEIMSDRQGRSFESHGVARHAMEPHTDPRREMRRRFAERIAGHLAAALARDEFDDLIVAAPPAMLGDLREAWSMHLRKHIVLEMPKDLLKLPLAELADHVAEAIAG
jgi:protein required for attachment to host cells